jgi:hypothetical protein
MKLFSLSLALAIMLLVPVDLQAQQVDSITVTGRFTMPASDNKGDIDSIVIAVHGVTGDSIPAKQVIKGSSLLPPGQQVNYQFRLRTVQVPSGGTMQLDVVSLASVFRRSSVTTTSSNTVPITIVDTPPPAVVNHIITVP